jgi:hypothetical protein
MLRSYGPQLFIRVHNETLSVAVRGRDPDRSLVRIPCVTHNPAF